MGRRIDWHLAFRSAIEIELRDYADILSYESEYELGRHYFSIDFLVIKKLSDKPILKALGEHFRALNFFEIKGIGSSITIQSYYKLIAYAGLYINYSWEKDSREYDDHPNITGDNITVNLISRSYPQKLIEHLVSRGKSVAKIADGIYDVGNETFVTRIIVCRELSEDDYLYLKALKTDLRRKDMELIKRLADDYKYHGNKKPYISYMNEFINANSTKEEGEKPMVCEAIFELFGTTSEDIRKQQEEKDYILINQANERADSALRQVDTERERADSALRQVDTERERADSALRQVASALKQADRYREMLIANGINPDE